MKQFLIAIFSFITTYLSYGQSNIPLLSPDYNIFFSDVDHETWVASAMQGYNRHRGIDTKYYLLNDSISGLEGSIIQSGIFKDTSGLLWTSTYEKLCYFEARSDKFICFSLRIHDQDVNAGYHVFHIDVANNLLFLRADGYLISYDVSKKKVHHLLGKTYGNWFTVSKDTILAAPWMNAPGFEIWSLQENEKDWKVQKFDLTDCGLKNTVSVIKAFKDKNFIWLITTNHGIIRFNQNHNCREYIYKNNQEILYSAAIKVDNKILIASTNMGVLIFDIQLEQYIEKSKIEEDRIDDLFLTSNGNIWMSNYKSGISSFPLLDLYACQSTKNQNDKWSKIINKNGILAFVNNDKRITFIKNGICRDIWIGSKMLPVLNIRHAEILNQNEILICDYNTCYLYNIQNQSSLKLGFNKGKQISDIKSNLDTLFYIADVNLYYTLASAGFSSGQIYTQKHQGKYQTIQTCVSETKSYAINSTFLYMQDLGKDTIVNIQSYIHNSIFDPLLKVHYIGTTSGLFAIDSQYRIVKLTDDTQYNVNKNILHLTQDVEWLYFTEGNRIARINKKTGWMTYFYKSEFQTSPAILVHKDSLIIAHNYVEIYKTDEAFRPLKQYKLILDNCLINEKSYTSQFKSSQQVNLEDNENQLHFRFFINHWESSELCKIKYKIAPLSTSWTMIANGETISTPYLSPEKYEIQVQGILSDGTKLEVTTYKFQILPPWHETLWFRSLIFVLLVLIGYVIYKYRVHQIKEKYKIKKELISLERSALQAQMNPHFIFNCLNSIQNFIMHNDKDLAMDYLWRFSRLIRQYLNASTMDLVTLDDEISMLENYLKLEQMRFNHSFDYHFEMAEHMDTSSINLPPLLIQPFVENAVLHGMAALKSDGLIIITINQEDKMLQVKIKDNGKGFKQENSNEMRRSLGISITQKRLQYINDHAEGNYSINTKSDENGTEINIIISIQ